MTVTGTLVELIARAADESSASGGGVVDGARERSWSELARESYRAANLLREHGVMSGQRVAMCLHNSVEQAMFAFATLATGAAYVPLDPASPTPRTALVCADADPAVIVVATVALAERLFAEPGLTGRPRLVILACANGPEQIAGVPVMYLGSDGAGLAAYPSSPPAVTIDPSDLAYVLFTSGSTGRPKGVAISHRAARCFVDWSQACVELGSGDRVGALTPLHFDLSVFDLYASVAGGATMVVVPRRIVGFATELAQYLAAQRVTVLYTVPTVLISLISRNMLSADAQPDLRVVMFAGEPLPIKHLRAMMLALPGRRYLNLYGPTETNVVSYHEVTQVPAESDPPTPIGKVCAGAQLFALDAQGQALAPGQIGELCVGGPVLMLGYWSPSPIAGGEPARGAGLVPDPREAESGVGVEVEGRGASIYRTGDLVSVDADGCYSWVGRASQTVKIAGYRIEPGEVEHRLLEHPGVAQAYVLARPHPQLGTQLEAVVVAALDTALDDRALQLHCARALPRWMVPARVRIVDEVPRTSTGKVDRRALLEPEPEPGTEASP
ncbi:amino acid adenylation domain-containing protein [Enhygromyxa salina]|uniref:Linear gramicidin synthase subunit D n=1 Tax=Enhygromyxa salina TaxID=215803 RepID=A0A2S9YN13_9BACT|nr:amino acid adenylation domain-containing protein [Enhygromyxa salina]PRQ06486.1 Linear gramicidin synthase subunit D [Enhygromyxa salina]